MKLNIFRKKTTDSGSDAAKALSESNPFGFKDAVADVHNNHGGGLVWVMIKTSLGGTPSFKQSFDVADVFAHDNFLQHVKDSNPDGLYVLRVFQKSGDKIHSDHHFSFGEIPDPTAKVKKEKTEAAGSKSFEREIMLKLMDKVLDKESSGDGMATKDLLLMQQQSHDKMLEMQQNNFQMLQTALQSGGGSMDEAIAILQLSRELAPQIEKEDALTSIVTSVAGPVLNLLAQRGGGNGAAAAARMGGIDKTRVREEVEKALGGLPPAPGSSQPAEEDPAGTVKPPQSGSQEYFYTRFVAPFREDAASDQAEEELAYQIVAMTQYARDRMPDRLPPLVADFVTATSINEHGIALAKFFAAIPELANLTQKQTDIRNALIRMFTAGPEQEIPEEEAAVVEDSDPTIIGEAEAAGGSADEDQPDHEEASSEVENEDVQGEVVHH